MTDWQSIIEKHGPRVWRTVYRLLSSTADAEDCFQETFIAAFELSQKEKIRQMEAVLVRIATARAMDRLRARFGRSGNTIELSDCEGLESRQFGPERLAESQELALHLQKALAQLPSMEAEVFCLRTFDEFSYRRIAKQLDIKANAVGVILHRAKLRLRGMLESVVVGEENEVPS